MRIGRITVSLRRAEEAPPKITQQEQTPEGQEVDVAEFGTRLCRGSRRVLRPHRGNRKHRDRGEGQKSGSHEAFRENAQRVA